MPTKPRQPEPPPAASPESPLVNNAKLRQIYTMMLHCRLLANRVSAWTAESRVAGHLQPAAAEEALLSATAVDLRPGDTLCFTQPDWLAAMLKGAPLPLIVRFLLSSTTPRKRTLKADAHHLRLLSTDSEEQLAAALETAITHKRKKGSLAILYITGAAPLAAWEKTLHFAGRRRLPLLIVSRARLLYEPTNAIPQEGTLGSLAQASGIPHIQVDGRDALAVYRVAQEATGRARRGIGTTLIECQMADRTALVEELADGSSEPLDPITGMERHLAAKGSFSLDWKQETQAAFTHQLETALAAYSRNKTAGPIRSA